MHTQSKGLHFVISKALDIFTKENCVQTKIPNMWNFRRMKALLLLLVSINLCFAQNSSIGEQSGSDVTDSGNREKTSLEKGMEPFFSMCHGFLKTVMSVDFYESQSSAFGKYKPYIGIVRCLNQYIHVYLYVHYYTGVVHCYKII